MDQTSHHRNNSTSTMSSGDSHKRSETPKVDTISIVSSEEAERGEGRSGNEKSDAVEVGGRGQLGSGILGWEGDNDPHNPQNFGGVVKLLIGVTLSSMNFVVTFAISAFPGELGGEEAQTGLGRKAAKLGVSLFVLGLALGPTFFGPTSEFYGRKRPLIGGMIGFVAFTLLCTTPVPTEGVLLFRFLAGFCGSAAFVIPPGIFVDLYGPVGRAIGYSVFTSGSYIGGALGPGVSAALLLEYSLNWRCTMWLISGIALLLIIGMAFLPESRASILLQRRSKHLREDAGDLFQQSQPDQAPAQLHKHLLKPWQMLIREPILMVLALAFTLDYGVQSLTYSAIPTAFQTYRAWSTVPSAWALAVTIPGFLVGCTVFVVDGKVRFQQKLAAGGMIEPERRLPPMIAGTGLLSMGLLLFAWNSSADSSWQGQCASEIVIGTGMYMVWVTATVYVQDLYTANANSALAACAFVRCSVGSLFPLIATPMYEGLGIQWAISALGVICACLVPFYVLLYFCGKRLRSWSRFATHSGAHI